MPVQLDLLLHELPHEKSDHGFHAMIAPSTGPDGAEPVETGFVSLKAA